MALRRVLILWVLLVTATTLSGCGGGTKAESGGGGAGTLPSKVLGWDPPQAYTDDSPLDPVTELDRIEIYVKEQGSFTEQDFPVATVAAIDPATRDLIKTFDLANLAPFINTGVVYRVSLRAVAKTEMKSDFSEPATFSF